MGETVAEVGEFGLIDRIRERLSGSPGVSVGVGDDAAVLAMPGETVLCTDALVEGKHFKLDWCSAADVGHRSAAASMSDIAAMGARPRALVVSLCLPADASVDWVMELVDGMSDEAAETGASLVGGDLARCDTVVVSVAAVGGVAPGRAVTRSGARPGDVVAIAGRQGWAAAGLTVLSRGFRSPRALVQAYQRPNPPYSSGPGAMEAGATSMIDVSDGLLADLRHIAVESKVLVDLESGLIPLADQLSETSSAFNVDPLTWVLGGGDDHSLVATFPSGARLPEMFTQIGRVVDLAGGPAGVSVDGRLWSGQGGGYDHFR
ncbi:MAG: thiamine-phosphate kinase [Candidatus Nanopelagicales bacterium]|nr:thiamine-phosphate kinase [Candidatus Nanopelagicales bacterium]